MPNTSTSPHGQTRVRHLEKRRYPDGCIKYCVPGREPDTAESLEADRLIKREFNKRGRWIDTLVLDPDNLRVLAWMIGIKFVRSQGAPEMFPDLHVDVVDGEPLGGTQ
jgi:hypothetical protein